ncbi:MAG: PilZ domain-containing protein [Spirochaetales bacterium]|nr:PilZ domain-containing protein [Spirochaetales bacterium]
MENRRKHMRIECLFKVKSSVQDQEHHGETVPVVAKDMSEGGLCVLSDVPLPEHALIFRFILPADDSQLDVNGYVVWSRELHDDFGKFESGVKFTPENNQAREAIRFLLKQF